MGRHPLSGETEVVVFRDTDDDTGLEAEHRVSVTFDEGAVFASVDVVTGQSIELTPSEVQRLEKDWAQRCAEERHDGGY